MYISDSYSTCKNALIEYIFVDIGGEGCKLNNYLKMPDVEGKKKPKVKGVSTAAELAISQGKASSIMANASAEETHPKGRGKKNKKIIRMAGGQTWEDPSLLEWDDGQ